MVRKKIYLKNNKYNNTINEIIGSPELIVSLPRLKASCCWRVFRSHSSVPIIVPGTEKLRREGMNE